MKVLVSLFLFLGACRPPYATPSILVEGSVGIVTPLSDTPSKPGAEFRLAAASGDRGNDHGSGIQLTFRRTGVTQELAIGLQRYQMWGDLHGSAVFIRGGLNLLEWDRVRTDDGLGAGGLRFEVGVGRDIKPGPCLVATGSRDFRFGYEDDTFLGIALGWCRIERSRAYSR